VDRSDPWFWKVWFGVTMDRNIIQTLLLRRSTTMGLGYSAFAPTTGVSIYEAHEIFFAPDVGLFGWCLVNGCLPCHPNLVNQCICVYTCSTCTHAWTSSLGAVTPYKRLYLFAGNQHPKKIISSLTVFDCHATLSVGRTPPVLTQLGITHAHVVCNDVLLSAIRRIASASLRHVLLDSAVDWTPSSLQ
jgi:hypothetical protein